MVARRILVSACLLLLCLWRLDARADSGMQAEEVYPDEYPHAVAFVRPGNVPLARITGRVGAWYAVCRMPIYPGKAYDLLLAHGGAAASMRLYALDNNPLEMATARHELYLRRLDFGGRNNAVYGTTIATLPNSSARRIYLLLEWLPQDDREMPRPLVFQAISSDPAGYAPKDRHGMYWAWHNEWQKPLNDLHVESPLQAERHRNADEAPPPEIAEPDRRSAPPYRLLPY